jgi:7-cyano-7-deazaguanine synthase
MTRTDASGAAVLFSGGLDSTVLLASELAQASAIWPIYVRTGLAWEAGEADVMARLLAAPPFAGRLNPLSTLDVDMRDIYPADHWAVVGRPPAFDTPDEDVYLEGRNVVLLGKASVLCARLGVNRLVLGPLAGNPFPDATPEFFAAMARALSLGLDRPFEIATPLAALQKNDVVRLGLQLGVPLEGTLSCMNPSAGRHCGVCSKCRERRDAFRTAGVVDGTAYATAPAR